MLLFDGTYSETQSLSEWVQGIYHLENLPDQPILAEGIPQIATYGWGFLLLSLLGISFIAVVIAFYRKRFSLLVNVFVNWKLSKQIIRYEKVHSHPVNILLMITFVIFFPLFYSLSISILKPDLDFLELLRMSSLFILLYFAVKLMLYQFSAWLFEEKELFGQYIFQLNLYTKLMGILLLFLWIFLVYSPISTQVLFNISLLILLLFLALQTYRGFIIGRSEGKHLLLIILYLCALEILPWLLIYKSLENNW